MRARRIDSFFGASRSGPLPEAEALLSLEKTMVSLLPSLLSQSCSIGKLDAGCLTLYADNGAVAMKLKQMQGTILAGLQGRGIRSLKIRVWVQKPQPLPALPRRELSEAALSSFSELEKTLPDSPLKDAVHHLIAKKRRASI